MKRVHFNLVPRSHSVSHLAVGDLGTRLGSFPTGLFLYTNVAADSFIAMECVYIVFFFLTVNSSSLT